MKKVGKVLLTIFLVVVIAVGIFAVYNRKYVAVLWKSITSSTEKITEEREKNNKELIEEINSYLDEELREFTEEEKERIENGEDEAVIYAEILSERSGKTYVYDVDKNEMIEIEKDSENQNSDTKNTAEQNETTKKTDDKKTENGKTDSAKTEKNKTDNTEKKKSADEIINKYMSQLYALQSAYTGRIQSLVSQGAAYYNKQVKLSDRATARAQTISHFTSVVRGEEASCDAQFEKIVGQLKGELEAIGADTSITEKARSAYQTEKQLKMSYYANKYLK